jgi:hypothetical protein
VTRDPFDIPVPRDVTPQKPDFRSEFWAQLPDMRPTVKREPPATFRTCRFDPQNKRVLHLRGGCPHFPPEDQ